MDTWSRFGWGLSIGSKCRKCAVRGDDVHNVYKPWRERTGGCGPLASPYGSMYSLFEDAGSTDPCQLWMLKPKSSSVSRYGPWEHEIENAEMTWTCNGREAACHHKHKQCNLRGHGGGIRHKSVRCKANAQRRSSTEMIWRK